jgi:ATP-dependent helicase/nuclease subunit B
VQLRFLLGPAGSGKTWRCLGEIQAELLNDPAGLPLLLLAPKQATFQLERQLLAHPELHGYTRLRVISLDRLATDLVEQSGRPVRLLSEEGRVMVLRALLTQYQSSLEVFRATARLPGLARQLSITLRDLCRHQLSPNRLRHQAAQRETEPGLAGKLRDCALLCEAYRSWLEGRQLEDVDSVIDLATEAVQRWTTPPPAPRAATADPPPLQIDSLWLDGFAEMTPQEIEFLAALLPRCRRATLAFCLADPPAPTSTPTSFTPWSVVSHTYSALSARLAHCPHLETSIEYLPRDLARSRFVASSALAHLERHWARPLPWPGDTDSVASSVALCACAHPEAEATRAAREILGHVRAGGRFRDTAILLRALDGHYAVIQRVLRRYQIPFFLDRRESVAHHPLAELTRYVLRTLSYGWAHDDWFGALKTGLLPAGAEDVDLLENEALARGWKGSAWPRPLELADSPPLRDRLEGVRRRVVPPLLELARALHLDSSTARPFSGQQLALALTSFWETLDVAGQLETWGQPAPAIATPTPPQPTSLQAVHQTVWEQMLAWTDNLALAFPDSALSLREWLPVLEAGLAELTVGVIPPALDQVLVGAIDRSRNPDLRLTIVMGLNEGQFPAAPAMPGLLTETDRRQLEARGLRLGPDRRTQLAHERYYAYIAFTRPRERLVVTWSERDETGQALLPSPLIHTLRSLFPQLEAERFDGAVRSSSLSAAVHPCELAPAWLAARRRAQTPAPNSSADDGTSRGTPLPDLPWVRRLEHLAAFSALDQLHPDTATALHGPVLRSSVSALERFAACPFRFFIAHSLRAEERRRFEVDARERGSFQHEVLARFHQELVDAKMRWRDLSPADARTRIRHAAESVAHSYRDGLFRSSPESAFAARALSVALEDFIEITVRWMATYRLDPVLVELPFGIRDRPLPPWTIELTDGRRLEFRGKIDRIDLARPDPASAPWVVVIDYKSSPRAFDPLLLEHGVQLQLPAYLAAVSSIPDIRRLLGAGELTPAGVFYVSLRGQYAPAHTRREVLGRAEAGRAEAYQHQGRFRLDALPLLDAGAPAHRSGQFRYRLKKSGEPMSTPPDLLSPERFLELLAGVEQHLRQAGQRILDGDIRVDPYRRGSEKACDQCDFQAICRIDPWTHRFRPLRRPTDAPVTAEDP